MVLYRGSGILLVNDQKVFLGLRKFNPFKGSWTIPGGKHNRRESDLSTALRELKEEIGFISKKPIYGKIIGYKIIRIPYLFQFTIFIVETKYQLKTFIKKPKEFYIARWFNKNTLPSPLHPGILELISSINKNVFTKMNKRVTIYLPRKLEKSRRVTNG